MKTKILFATLLSFVFCLVSSQVPQGFNYQALALDGGNPIKNYNNLRVMLSVLSDTITPVVIWEELHNPVKTDGFGVFSVVMGTGVRQSGSALTFKDIDWTKAPLYLKTQIYYPSSWKYMGTSRLWSVPYSLVAKDLGGSINKLKVSGTETNMDSALFEVRNRTGQIVFAVYNEGVRIYVDDGLAKGATKGGFAIGGFGTAKGTSQPYFVVDPDSIRAYIDNNPVKAVKGGFAIGGFNRNKGANQQFLTVSDDSVRIYINDDLLSKAVKGGFAIGSFDKSKGGNTNFFNVSPDSSGRIYPSQNRILWYPLKNAFLTGKVLVENKDSVGVNSFASGFESRAKGKYSQALGYKAIARGDYSTAFGKNTVANNINSFALGDSVSATAQNSYVFGKKSAASGNGSYAFGYSARASGQDSYAFGTGTEASGIGSFAMGFIGRDSAGNATGNTKAISDYSIAFGMGAQAKALGALAIGVLSQTTGEFSTSLGYQAISGDFSVAIGRTVSANYLSVAIGSYSRASDGSEAIGDYNIAQNGSTALGGWTKATGHNSTTTGYQTIASGDYSTAIGINTTSKGYSTTVMGFGTVASGYFATASGYNTIAKPRNTFVTGQYNDTTCSATGATTWILTDPLFICGNGTSSGLRKNAFTVYKNGDAYIQGNLGIGTTLPASKLDILGGNWDVASTEGDLRVGNGTYRLKFGVATGGVGSGDARINSVGGTNRMILGGGGSDVLLINNINVLPYIDNRASLGASSNRWTAVYAVNGTINTSDVRLKMNIIELPYGLKSILDLNPVCFKWIDDKSGKRRLGLLAQDVEKVISEVVEIGTDPAHTMGINYSELIPVLIKGMQEQQAIVDKQQKEIDELKSLVNTLVANQTGQGNK